MTDSSTLLRSLQRRSVKTVKRQELRIAADIDGGKRQPGSGNQWHAKGDVKGEALLIECKSTSNASYGLKLELLEKINREAVLTGREPLFQIDYIQGSRIQSFVVVSYERFMQLLEGEKK